MLTPYQVAFRTDTKSYLLIYEHLPDMRLFTLEIPAAQLPSVTEIRRNHHYVQGRSQDFSKGGSPSGDRRLYMVYTAALPRVSAGSVVLSRHEGPY